MLFSYYGLFFNLILCASLCFLIYSDLVYSLSPTSITQLMIHSLILFTTVSVSFAPNAPVISQTLRQHRISSQFPKT